MTVRCVTGRPRPSLLSGTSGIIVPFMFMLYVFVLIYALSSEDKGSLRVLPHFTWLGTLLFLATFWGKYRLWAGPSIHTTLEP